MSTAAPMDLVSIGYYTRNQIDRLRAANIRAWADPEPFDKRQHRTYVEPWVKDLLRKYHEYRSSTGHTYGDMSTIDFLVAAAGRVSPK